MTTQTRAGLVERLRTVLAGDYDTHGTLRIGGRTICDVPLISDADAVAEACHEAAAEIERLRAKLREARMQALADAGRAQIDAEDMLRLQADNERLRAALQEIFALPECENRPDLPGYATGHDDARIDALHIARAALDGTP